MAKVQTNVDLLPYNTFRVPAKAKYFLELNDISDLQDLPKEKRLILGEGANVLFTKDFDGLVIKNNLCGKTQIGEDTFEIASGENWIDLVNWSVENSWSGLEKLAFIPGTVGGAAVGNIGAYGQTFENVFVSAKANGEVFQKKDCEFFYRGSAFKNGRKDYFVESVKIQLSRDLNSKKVAEETTAIRQSKLPDWKTLGTAGSFFKNPFVSQEKLDSLKRDFPNLPNFFTPRSPEQSRRGEVGPDSFKIPAGWLLEKCGWKGKRIGNVGTYEKHALVVVNYGGATGQEILDFTRQMQSDVREAYNIDLEPEVNII